MMINQSGTSGPVIHVNIDFRAPRDKVFKTWTDADLLSKWFFAEEGFLTTQARVDLQPLGAYELVIRPATEGEPTTIHGNFLEVEPGQRLCYSWTGACAGEQYWTLVTVSFADNDTGGSSIQLTHGVFQNEADRASHEQGWIGCVNQLANLLGETIEA